MVNFTFIFSLLYSVDFLLIFMLCTLCFIGVLLPALFFLLKARVIRKKSLDQKSGKFNDNVKLAFFHPYCNAGGGGERVLWVAIAAILQKYPNVDVYVYTGDIEAQPLEILTKVERLLNVHLPTGKITFIYLHRRRWLESDLYPYFTLLAQALGSLYLGLEAILQLCPDIYFETTGYTFTLPLFKYLGGCKTACYIHYPTIHREMLRRVHSRTQMYNNRARNPFLTHTKLVYYQLFTWAYSVAGQCADLVLVNSTFTKEHLSAIWPTALPLHLVYPPCDVDHLKQLPTTKITTTTTTLKLKETTSPPIRILSVAQFRPEKDHPLQLQMLYELREIIAEEQFRRVTLALCGGCRNAADAARVRDLKDLSKHLSLENNVEFLVNLTYEELLEQYAHAHIGIHTMLDEHFGIGVVEMMAAGLLVVGHRSGGPLLDIIVEEPPESRLGFLANSAEQYAHIIKFLLEYQQMDADDENSGGEESVNELQAIRLRARASVERFSRQRFEQEFLRVIQPLFK